MRLARAVRARDSAAAIEPEAVRFGPLGSVVDEERIRVVQMDEDPPRRGHGGKAREPVADGRVRRARGFFDLYDAATQLGLLPARGGLGETVLLMLRGFGLRRRPE